MYKIGVKQLFPHSLELSYQNHTTLLKEVLGIEMKSEEDESAGSRKIVLSIKLEMGDKYNLIYLSRVQGEEVNLLVGL